MNLDRFSQIVSRYRELPIAVVGDFCLDRYFEIDPARAEISIETGLEVHNITRVRCQPGAAGTILNNLVALGAGSLHPVGMCGEDGEGFELKRSLAARRGVSLEHFVESPSVRTFTYTKPLIIDPPKAPRELNRLDIKNWHPIPDPVRRLLAGHVRMLASSARAMIVMDQVDVAETGVVTPPVLEAVAQAAREHPGLVIIADSRRGLAGFPKVIFKMNHAELSAMTSLPARASIGEIQDAARGLAVRNGRPVFVTLAERGMVAADPVGEASHVPALPLRGEIDIVGAGDSVTANLASAMAAGATLREALEIASCAASVVIHQLGTTGTASPEQIAELIPLLSSS